MAERPNTPPHSDEAEQAVLGALLIDNRAFETVGALLRAEDFYSPDHGAIYRTAQQLVATGKPADVVTVCEAGGFDAQYVNALALCVPGASAAKHYAEIVRERSLRREVMRVCAAAGEQAMAGTTEQQPIGQVIDRAITDLLALQQKGAPSEPRPIRELSIEFLDDLQARADGVTNVIATGLFDLDKLTGDGGRPGELWVIGARPSMGKTAFMLSLCRHVGASHQVLVLTQEDSLLALTARYVAAAGRINLADLRNPRAAPASMWHGVPQAVQEIAPLRIDMDDQVGLTVADVRRKMQQTRRKHGALSLVVIDYLQLMVGEGENRNQTLGQIAYGLQRAAKQLGCWVVLLSQLSREADKRNGPPQMSDLRDSGDIEGAADLIGMLYREFMRRPTDGNKHLAELHVCKQKNGPTDTIKLFFDGATQRFGNWDRFSGGED